MKPLPLSLELELAGAPPNENPPAGGAGALKPFVEAALPKEKPPDGGAGGFGPLVEMLGDPKLNPAAGGAGGFGPLAVELAVLPKENPPEGAAGGLASPSATVDSTETSPEGEGAGGGEGPDESVCVSKENSAPASAGPVAPELFVSFSTCADGTRLKLSAVLSPGAPSRIPASLCIVADDGNLPLSL